MSWTDSFPVMSEDMVDEFLEFSTPEDRARFQNSYGVKQIFNPRDTPELVTFSLFNTSAESADPGSRGGLELQSPGSGVIIDMGHDASARYLKLIVEEAPKLLETQEDLAFRVYLACDLESYVPDLVAAGCEVYLMRAGSSDKGAAEIWKTLAFSEKGRLITVADSNNLKGLVLDLDRSRTMRKSGLSCWREPRIRDFDITDKKVVYRSLMSARIGVEGGLEIERLLQAFLWHHKKRSFADVVSIPGCSPKPLSDHGWSSYGLEEWFLTVAMYPRIAALGMLTFVPVGLHSSLLLMDVEYSTWANSRSEMVLYASSACCGQKSA